MILSLLKSYRMLCVILLVPPTLPLLSLKSEPKALVVHSLCLSPSISLYENLLYPIFHHYYVIVLRLTCGPPAYMPLYQPQSYYILVLLRLKLLLYKRGKNLQTSSAMRVF